MDVLHVHRILIDALVNSHLDLEPLSCIRPIVAWAIAKRIDILPCTPDLR